MLLQKIEEGAKERANLFRFIYDFIAKILKESQEPIVDEKSWDDLVPLLGSAMKATYSFSEPQLPEFPPGVTFLSQKFLGKERTNCSVFTAYFLGCGLDVEFSLDQWKEWQLARGPSKSMYKQYGPGVCAEWGVATMVPPDTKPKDGVYLLQTFSSWPAGHSWLVIDYDEETDKALTLEANTSGSGLNGVGFGGLGPIRSTNAANWTERVKTTWTERIGKSDEVYMCRLDIDHQSVKDWLARQQ